jgi:hypothetical protein
MTASETPPVHRFTSLDELYKALSTHAVPAVRSDGVVRVSHLTFAERGLAHLLDARRRVGTYGLVLVITPTLVTGVVELQCRR